MINVYDHNTGEYKILSCGNALFRMLRDAMDVNLETDIKKVSLLESIRKWIDKTVLKKSLNAAL